MGNYMLCLQEAKIRTPQKNNYITLGKSVDPSISHNFVPQCKF